MGGTGGEQRLAPSLTRRLSFANVRCILRSCMAHYSEDAIADSAVSLRHWILPAIALSFLFHCGLFYYFSTRTLDRFVQTDIPRLVPRVFNVNRLQIDQKLLDNDSKPAATPGKPAGDFGTIANLTQFDGSFEKDIQELRQFIDAGTANKTADSGNPRIVGHLVNRRFHVLVSSVKRSLNHSLHKLFVYLGVVPDFHRAKLQKCKFLAELTHRNPDQAGQADHHRQQVVEIMYRAAGEFTDYDDASLKERMETIKNKTKKQ